MAVIHPKGLLEGKRLRKCAPRARLFWPYLYSLSNGFARIELDYELLADKFLTFRDQAPNPQDLELFFGEYSKNNLVFLYSLKDQLWAQWDITEEGDLKRFATREELRCPAPPEPEYTDWLRDLHGEDWEQFHVAKLSSRLTEIRAEAGRKGGTATQAKRGKPQANPSNAKQTEQAKAKDLAQATAKEKEMAKAISSGQDSNFVWSASSDEAEEGLVTKPLVEFGLGKVSEDEVTKLVAMFNHLAEERGIGEADPAHFCELLLAHSYDALADYLFWSFRISKFFIVQSSLHFKNALSSIIPSFAKWDASKITRMRQQLEAELFEWPERADEIAEGGAAANRTGFDIDDDFS